MKSSIYINPNTPNDILNQLSSLCPKLTLIQVESFNPKDYVGLYFENNILSYYHFSYGHFKVDFDGILRDFRRQNIGRKELIAKAVGSCPNIVDASFGTGRDSLTLSHLGYHLEAIENNPIVFLIAKFHLNNPHINLHLGNSFEWIRNQLIKESVIYFDPMFRPEKRKSLPKKNMQIFEDLINDEPEFDSVTISEIVKLDLVKRVVIKRPKKGALLLDNPHHQIIGKTVRFDVYM